MPLPHSILASLQKPVISIRQLNQLLAQTRKLTIPPWLVRSIRSFLTHMGVLIASMIVGFLMLVVAQYFGVDDVGYSRQIL